MDDYFTCNIVYGTVEPKTLRKFENGRMVTYSYAIHRDRHGRITKETEMEPLSSIGYDNGTPFTKTDYDMLKTGFEAKKGFWEKLGDRLLGS